MPPPWDAIGALARCPDGGLVQQVTFGSGTASVSFVLYDLLRAEQAMTVEVRRRERAELEDILDLAQTAYGDLVGLLVGRDDALLERAHDGEWSLRDLLRHAIAVELRYAAQVDYAAGRRDGEPLAIPDALLPCDRLTPPEPAYAGARTGGIAEVLALLGLARAATSQRLGRIPSGALDRPSLWTRLRMSVRMRAHQIAAHLTEVVLQAEKMLSPDAGGSEARRIVRRCCAMRGSHELRSDEAARGELDQRYRSLARTLV